jgi:glycosyltransferase involved in cell wall biosynthesis
LLVFILTYGASRHIHAVVNRIPRDLVDDFDVEVLLIDDGSTDGTPAAARESLRDAALPYPWTLLANPVNQGYGGNQKLGYRYAIDNAFDVVVMLHGDGQYPAEQIRPLAVLALQNGAAFGSRFATPGGARFGGMPRYKFIGNRILSSLQNRMLGTALSEFHSGFRAYRTDLLASVPFELNADDFHFDTEIFIQCIRAGVDIAEMPIATRYGDEECRVQGFKYAAKVVSQTTRAALQDKGLFYERKFDIARRGGPYESKLGFASPARSACDRIPDGSIVLDVGSSDGHLAKALRDKGCQVIGVDLVEPDNAGNFDEFIKWDLDHGLPPVGRSVDVVVLADVVEHLRSPEDFADDLASFCREHDVRTVLVSTGNVAFAVQRLMLVLGQFNYGPRGILDMTHTRLFTARTIRRLFLQAGFRVRESFGLPAPFPLAFGDRPIGRRLLAANRAAIRISTTLFSYQIFLVLEPPSDLARVIARSARHPESATGPACRAASEASST